MYFQRDALQGGELSDATRQLSCRGRSDVESLDITRRRVWHQPGWLIFKGGWHPCGLGFDGCDIHRGGWTSRGHRTHNVDLPFPALLLLVRRPAREANCDLTRKVGQHMFMVSRGSASPFSTRGGGLCAPFSPGGPVLHSPLEGSCSPFSPRGVIFSILRREGWVMFSILHRIIFSKL